MSGSRKFFLYEVSNSDNVLRIQIPLKVGNYQPDDGPILNAGLITLLFVRCGGGGLDQYC